MNGFIRFFASRPMLANILLILILLAGSLSLMSIKKDVYPEVEFGEVVISTQYPGASPEDVEINVTNKLEDELNSVTGIDKMISVSLKNSSIINIVIESDADIDEVVKDIRDAVDRVSDLPVEVEQSPLIIEASTAEIPIIEVGIYDVENKLSYEELREISRVYKKQLKRVFGVSKISSFGYRDREVRIEVNPDALKRYQVSMTDIIQAIGQRNLRATGGSIESYVNEQNIVTLAEFKDPKEVGEVIVRSTFEGPLVRVKDLAKVIDGFEEETVISRMNGKKAISFVVFKSENADIIKTMEAVKAFNDSYSFPESIELTYANDISRYVSNRLKVVTSNALIGLVLVLIMLSLFFTFKTAFWVALGIPFSIFGVFLLMPMFGTYIEVVSLTAFIIVIGIIVDDAIIISENIVRHREMGKAPLEATVDGVKEVAGPVITTILTTFLAFAPMFFMSGIMGKFVFVIPLVISIALLFSTIEVFIVLPAHINKDLAKLVPGKANMHEHWFDKVRDPFHNFIKRALPFRWALVGLFVGIFAFGIFLATTMDFELFPTEAADVFSVQMEVEAGSSLEATLEKVLLVEQLIKDIPKNEIDSFITRVGIKDDPQAFVKSYSENMGSILVNLSPINMRKRNANDIVEMLREQGQALQSEFVSLAFNVDGGGPPVGKPIELRVVSSDDETRKDATRAIVAFLKKTTGVHSVERNDKAGKPQLEIDLDYEKLARYGLSVSDVTKQVRLAYDGLDVSTTRYGDEDVDFRVVLNKSVRQSPDYLSQLPIPNQTGQLILLKDVAKFKQIAGLSTIYHYDAERSTTITADINRDVTTPIEVIDAVYAAFNFEQQFPGVQIIEGGESDETNKSMADLGKTFIVAAVSIYLLLVLLFNSFAQPLIVMLAIPFGLIGVIFAFKLHNAALGFFAIMGVIGMSGVVVNDSLVLVSYINDLIRDNKDEPVIDLVARATATRLRPIVVTSLTTVGGVLPLAYGLGGSDPFMAPMALALGYGLVFAVPLTIILLPCFYMMKLDMQSFFGGLFSRKK